MKTYDLNLKNGVHIVEIILQCGAYKGRIINMVHGNCFGNDVLGFDFESEDADVKNDCNLQYDEDYDLWSAELHDKDGNILQVDEDSVSFGKMVVKNEIIKQLKNTGEAIEYIKTLS